MKKNIIARIILSAIAVLMCMATDAQTKRKTGHNSIAMPIRTKL